MTGKDSVRRALLCSAALVFAFFLLSIGTLSKVAPGSLLPSLSLGKDAPDFGQYVPHRTLSPKELDGRVIVIGDIHGMYPRLQQLLFKLSYNPATDHLIHTGDLTAKGPVEGSLSIISNFALNNITGVRGNHDQITIEWRGWIDWIFSKKHGREWLEEMEKQYENDIKVDDALMEYQTGKKWMKIPKKWTFMDDHYQIARAMTPAQYEYIRNLPLVLHMPSVHSYVVHAGILPSDPRESITHDDQPLAHIPELKPKHQHEENRTRVLRFMQERAVLSDIEQNTDPWVLENMRSIKKNKKVTKNGDKGQPWSEFWNSVMDRCNGFDEGDHEDEDEYDFKAVKLPCRPSTVIYGHAATRGLDVKRWSIGIDSGCVYGQRLTAFVFGSRHELEEGIEDGWVSFGDDDTARLVSINC